MDGAGEGMIGRTEAVSIETLLSLQADRRAEVDRLIREAAAVDGVPAVGEHKYLKLHGDDGPVRAFLAYGGARLVGFAQVLEGPIQATAEIVVHPDARGRGVGRRLLTAAEELAASGGAPTLKVWAYGALASSAAFAARRGMAVCRTLLQLEAPLDDLPPAPNLGADGVAVRSFDAARDAEAWLRLHNAVFADHPENGTWSVNDLAARLVQPWFVADDFLIAEADGRMVGFNWLKRVPEVPPDRPEGEIYVIGVDGSQRGRGLGRALAILGLHHLRRRGMRVASLYVEADNVPALKLYRALGFGLRHTHRCYALPLGRTAEAMGIGTVRSVGAPTAGR